MRPPAVHLSLDCNVYCDKTLDCSITSAATPRFKQNPMFVFTDQRTIAIMYITKIKEITSEQCKGRILSCLSPSQLSHTMGCTDQTPFHSWTLTGGILVPWDAPHCTGKSAAKGTVVADQVAPFWLTSKILSHAALTCLFTGSFPYVNESNMKYSEGNSGVSCSQLCHQLLCSFLFITCQWGNVTYGRMCEGCTAFHLSIPALQVRHVYMSSSPDLLSFLCKWTAGMLFPILKLYRIF